MRNAAANRPQQSKTLFFTVSALLIFLPLRKVQLNVLHFLAYQFYGLFGYGAHQNIQETLDRNSELIILLSERQKN